MTKNFTVINLSAKVKIPTVPNFLITENGTALPLCAFTDESLRQVAQAWTADLLNNANRQRIDAAKDAERSEPSR